MHPSLVQVDHRPWPLPERSWIWRQSWLDLAFIHYRVEASALRNFLPEGLELQEFDGSAWLGVVPFRMDDVMARGLPAVPRFSKFPELNVRTYVEHRGVSGVWFLSLDAASLPFVVGGRVLYGLPYHFARMGIRAGENGWSFESRRHFHGPSFVAHYRPLGELAPAQPGSFAHWAAERYCLYACGPGRRLLRLQVHHPPWLLQPVEMRIDHNEMAAAAGIEPLDEPPVCHFSPGVHVIGWRGENLGKTAGSG